jgi:hypothetical protein
MKFVIVKKVFLINAINFLENVARLRIMIV